MTPLEIVEVLINPSLEGLCRIATMKGQYVALGMYDEAKYYLDIQIEIVEKLRLREHAVW
jgi:hypothetical protein